MKVTLTVHGKEHNGEEFVFDEPGSFLFGSSKSAKCRITGDSYVSRNHFYLLIDPSEVRLCDLQSTNGTEVDGTLYTGGKGDEPEDDEEMDTFVKGEDPPTGEEVILRDRSEIEAGYTKITVAIEEDAQCDRCSAVISHDEKDKAKSDDCFICEDCQETQRKAEEEKDSGPTKRKAHEEAHKKELERIEQEKKERLKQLVKDGNQLIGQRKGREALAKFREAKKLDPAYPGVKKGLDLAGRLSVLIGASGPRPPGSPQRSDALLRLILGNLRMARPKGTIPDIPNYKLVRKIDAGGMGAVFEARKMDSGTKVAIKIIIPDHPVSKEALKRFRREILITQELDHPHIVKVIEANKVGDHLWLALEFVENGWDVGKEIRKRGRLPVAEAVPLAIQALDGLARAHGHKKRIVHRDIKPPNILLVRENDSFHAKVSDFGLAKCLEESKLNGSFVTNQGRGMGTLPYMPPEQMVDITKARPYTDVFSMGATLYYMMTGMLIRNFARNHNRMIRQIVQDPVIPIRKRNPSIPKTLADVVGKSLCLEPDDRYADATEFKAALEALTL